MPEKNKIKNIYIFFLIKLKLKIKNMQYIWEYGGTYGQLTLKAAGTWSMLGLKGQYLHKWNMFPRRHTG